MTHTVIIIGSGFAAYQLVKTIRRMSTDIAIQVITADTGDVYNKPDLSHVFSRHQTANDLVTQTGEEFAAEHGVELIKGVVVTNIDTTQQIVVAGGAEYPYSKLVLATGANSFIPSMLGDGVERVHTLNSLREYQSAQDALMRAEKVLLIGGGIIGVELAMDLATSGKKVMLVEPSDHLMSSILPSFVSVELEAQLRSLGVEVYTRSVVERIDSNGTNSLVELNNGQSLGVDEVISTAGLRPNISLAKQLGADTNRGVCVDHRMMTSIADIYALGDCAEMNGRVMAYLQPAIMAANAIAQDIVSGQGELRLPAMMVKIKTPNYPIQIGGDVSRVDNWQASISASGLSAKGYDHGGKMMGFVVTNEAVSQAFPLLRELQTQ
ncbi:NADH:flavorubredoxin reductase NorW [Vibrio astriarenae]|uniref:NADH:flavorubredoxin reductase NorW n=1 Tax=Vibrio astriarenae TaxID=1481923 RepID=UPI003735D512